MNKKDYVLMFILVVLCILVIFIDSTAQGFYDQLNSYRVHKNMKPLLIDSSLEKKSNERINIIIRKYHGALIHGACNPSESEVLAKNCDLECWLDSKKHKKILLNRRARRIGFASNNGISCARLIE